MKRRVFLLPLLLATLLGCSKRVNDPFIAEEETGVDSIYQEPIDPFMGIPEKMSVILVKASTTKYNPWQKFYVSPEKATIIMWPSHDRSLVVKDAKQAIQGIAFDTKTNEEVKTDNITFTSGLQLQDCRPGKYLIAVVLNDENETGKLAYSTKEIIVREQGKIYMHKIFSANVKDGELEEWSPRLIEK